MKCAVRSTGDLECVANPRTGRCGWCERDMRAELGKAAKLSNLARRQRDGAPIAAQRTDVWTAIEAWELAPAGDERNAAAEYVDSVLDELEHELLTKHTLIKQCACGAPLPSRERLGAILDGAMQHLNQAKLSDAVHGALPDRTIQSLALLAHAVLRASSMLQRCERCCDRAVEQAAARIVNRIEG